jgi:hypothetical protein
VTIHTNYGKTSSAERNSGRKPNLSETDHRTLKRIVEKNYRTAAENMTAELNILRKTLFPQKETVKGFLNPKSTVELQLLNL